MANGDGVVHGRTLSPRPLPMRASGSRLIDELRITRRAFNELYASVAQESIEELGRRIRQQLANISRRFREREDILQRFVVEESDVIDFEKDAADIAVVAKDLYYETHASYRYAEVIADNIAKRATNGSMLTRSPMYRYLLTETTQTDELAKVLANLRDRLHYRFGWQAGSMVRTYFQVRLIADAKKRGNGSRKRDSRNREGDSRLVIPIPTISFFGWAQYGAGEKRIFIQYPPRELDGLNFRIPVDDETGRKLWEEARQGFDIAFSGIKTPKVYDEVLGALDDGR